MLLVSERDNPFLAELLGRQDALRLSRADPDTFDAEDAAESFDLIILDNFCPPELPEGNWMIFGAPLPLEGFVVRPDILELPPVVDWDRTSPITRFADFSFITVGEALDFTPPAYAQTLIESNQGPLVCLIERGPMSILYAGFDLYQSDWPWLWPPACMPAVREMWWS